MKELALERLRCKDHDDWIKKRSEGIGASEIAAAIGISPFMSTLDLWKIKTGRKKPKDLSGDPRVEFGKNVEQHIRGIFLLEHPEYKGTYNEFDILYQTEHPFIRATLDGELEEISTGRLGILEIKAVECTKKVQWEKWQGKVPDYYYAQLLHQLCAAGSEYQFSYLSAKIKGLSGDSSLRNYEYEREEAQGGIDWLLDKAERFWWYVENDTMPPLQLA